MRAARQDPSESEQAGQAEGATSRRLLGRRRSLALLAALTLLILASASLAASGAIAPLLRGAPPAPPEPPTPPAPSIGARPADPTAQTAAHFTYADAQSGVSFQCQLDGGSFANCPASGVSYGPLSERSHTFKVRAVAGSKTSSASSYTWTIDTTPPSASISYPTGVTLGAAEWGARCPGHVAICGSATDSGGVASVTISIQRDGGKWWGGSAFDQSSESFRTAALDRPGHDSTSWGFSLPRPADGSYTLHVRATDETGNKTSAAAQTVAHFTLDTTPPPVPTISSRPQSSTTSKSASFGFADAEPGATLLCRRDGARFARCSSPISYGSLSLGAHSFEVQARDAVGNTSAATGFSWTIVKEVKKEEGKPFTVSGGASSPLAPGVSRPLAITVSNPNNVAILVTALSATVASGSSKASCDGPTNLALTQSSVSEANPLAVPANGQVTLPSGAVSAPQVLMKDLPVNQDACKGATFTFTYSGSAHS
jgi:Bacterial Ig-like domain